MNDTRDVGINFRTTERERQLIKDAAKNHGMSVANFILSDPRIGEVVTDNRIQINTAMPDNPLTRPGLRFGNWPAESEKE